MKRRAAVDACDGRAAASAQMLRDLQALQSFVAVFAYEEDHCFDRFASTACSCSQVLHSLSERNARLARVKRCGDACSCSCTALALWSKEVWRATNAPQRCCAVSASGVRCTQVTATSRHARTPKWQLQFCVKLAACKALASKRKAPRGAPPTSPNTVTTVCSQGLHPPVLAL